MTAPTSDLPTSERAFLIAGVRFLRHATRTSTAAGHSVTLDQIRVQGPRDDALMAQLRAEVTRRVGLVADLKAARKRVVEQYPGPMAVRSGMGKDGKPWRAEVLPEGVCETCGGTTGRIAEQDGQTVVRSGWSGMCALCRIARMMVLDARWSACAAKVAA
jgi:hypothetical protein